MELFGYAVNWAAIDDWLDGLFDHPALRDQLVASIALAACLGVVFSAVLAGIGFAVRRWRADTSEVQCRRVGIVIGMAAGFASPTAPPLWLVATAGVAGLVVYAPRSRRRADAWSGGRAVFWTVAGPACLAGAVALAAVAAAYPAPAFAVALILWAAGIVNLRGPGPRASRPGNARLRLRQKRGARPTRDDTRGWRLAPVQVVVTALALSAVATERIVRLEVEGPPFLWAPLAGLVLASVLSLLYTRARRAGTRRAVQGSRVLLAAGAAGMGLGGLAMPGSWRYAAVGLLVALLLVTALHTAFEPVDRRDRRPVKHPVWATIGLCVAALMTTIDGSIMNVAAPVIAKELRASASELVWTVNAYGVTSVGLLIVSGSLGARFGRRRMLTIGCVIFGVGSFSALWAETPEQLIVIRVLLGVGGALVFPSTLGMLGDLFRDRRKTAVAITVWSLMAALGYAAGPPLAGWLLSHDESAWEAVFLVGLAFVLPVLAIVACRALPESRTPKPPRVTLAQVVSMVLATLGPLALVWGLIAIPEGVDAWVLVSLAGGVVACGVFVALQVRSEHPVLDLSLMRQRSVVAAVMALAVAYTVVAGTLYVLPQYLQGVMSYSPLRTGVGMLPAALAIVAGALAGRILGRWLSDAAIVAGGLVIGACAVMAWSQTPADVGYWMIAGALGAAAFGLGLVQPAVTNIIMGQATPERAGHGATLNELARGIPLALGVAVAHLLVTGAMHSRMGLAIEASGLVGSAADQARQHILAVKQVAESGVPGAERLMAAAVTSFVDALHLWFLAAGGGLAIAAVAVFFLLRRAPATPPAGNPAKVPSWRGMLHIAATIVSLPVGALIIFGAPEPGRWAAIVYMLTTIGLFACSANLHRGRWPGYATRYRIDHAMIWLGIAGEYTPLILVLHLPAWALWMVWGYAVTMAAVFFAWRNPPAWLKNALFFVLGASAWILLPGIWVTFGPVVGVMCCAGGLFYMAGVVIFSCKPRWRPRVTFGGHEWFHLYTIAGRICFMVPIATVMLAAI